MPSQRGVPGGTVQDEDDSRVRFWIRVEAGRVAAIQYSASSCTTLLALCEHLSELTLGRDLTAVAGITAEELLALHPEIAPSKRSRSNLAVRALRQAVRAASEA